MLRLRRKLKHLVIKDEQCYKQSFITLITFLHAIKPASTSVAFIRWWRLADVRWMFRRPQFSRWWTPIAKIQHVSASSTPLSWNSFQSFIISGESIVISLLPRCSVC